MAKSLSEMEFPPRKQVYEQLLVIHRFASILHYLDPLKAHIREMVQMQLSPFQRQENLGHEAPDPAPKVTELTEKREAGERGEAPS